MTRLSEEMSLDRTTVTRNIQMMERGGLVKITSGADRRVREIQLTEHGRATYARGVLLWQEAEDAPNSKLGEKNRKALLDVAARLSSISEAKL
jgi:DNA-binding MarR family transcriptional regulator